MKKLLLSLTAAALLLSTGLSAQSSYSTIGYVPDIWGSVNDSYLVSKFKVKNNTSATLTTQCKKEIISAIGLTTNDFCWGMGCYDTVTYVSLTSATIVGYGEDSTFKASYFPNSQLGTTTIRYRFYDKNDPTDSVSVVVRYHVTGVSVEPKQKTAVTLDASPNPSKGTSVIRYAMDGQSGQLLIHNMLGALVQEIPLDAKAGVVSLDTKSFQPGLYFYSLRSAGQVLSTKKLVVAN